jgi:hypothetical protein
VRIWSPALSACIPALPFPSLVSVMAPTPEVWNPLRPIQDKWDKIEDVQGKYSALLGGIGIVFGFVASLALVVEHNFKLPKWPFTKERWFPKPTEVKEREGKETEVVTEEDLIEDELAEVAGAAGGLKKRYLEFKWVMDHPVISRRVRLRDGGQWKQGNARASHRRMTRVDG